MPQLTGVGPTSWMKNGGIMSAAADRSYPLRLKISPASYIGRKDRFVKSFASSLGWLSARHLQLGNLPIIKNGKSSYNSPPFIY
jgi:hypothetical protein